MNILSPEKSIYFLKYYHKSSKIMLPLMGISGLLELYKYNNIKNYNNLPNVEENVKSKIETNSKLNNSAFEQFVNGVHMCNVLNVGYHSYISTSCVITDYIKNAKIEKISRVVNAKCHILSMIGFGYYIFNFSKKNA